MDFAGIQPLTPADGIAPSSRADEIDDDANAGHGRIEWTRTAGGETALTRARANSPLKLLSPRHRGESSWVFASTYGGGLVAGDHVHLRLRAGPGTTGLLGTQAATKIYRSPAGRPSRQTTEAAVDDGATCVVLPDPVTCFAGAVYEQRQRYDLAAGGNLVLLDWLTSGRRAAGERWAFARYDARIDIAVAGRRVFRDALLLDPADGPLAAPARMGRFDCLAVVVLWGDRLRPAAEGVLKCVATEPVRCGADLLFSASPLAGGAVVRVAGTDTEAVGRWLRERLDFVPPLLGDDPWARKF